MRSRRSSYNHCLELGIYINVIVRWFIHASVVSYVKKNNALGSIKTIEHVALRRLRRELISLTRRLTCERRGGIRRYNITAGIEKHVNS